MIKGLGGLGGLGNMMDMVKQAQEMQGRMQAMQEALERAEIEGVSGGGLVRVTLSGKGDMKRLRIDPSLIKSDEAEVLEDLIVAAHADAKARNEAEMAKRMSELTGGMQLPPGFKLPF